MPGGLLVDKRKLEGKIIDALHGNTMVTLHREFQGVTVTHQTRPFGWEFPPDRWKHGKRFLI
jgi:hypothetical protein